MTEFIAYNPATKSRDLVLESLYTTDDGLYVVVRTKPYRIYHVGCGKYIPIPDTKGFTQKIAKAFADDFSKQGFFDAAGDKVKSRSAQAVKWVRDWEYTPAA